MGRLETRPSPSSKRRLKLSACFLRLVAVLQENRTSAVGFFLVSNDAWRVWRQNPCFNSICENHGKPSSRNMLLRPDFPRSVRHLITIDNSAFDRPCNTLSRPVRYLASVNKIAKNSIHLLIRHSIAAIQHVGNNRHRSLSANRSMGIKKPALRSLVSANHSIRHSPVDRTCVILIIIDIDQPGCVNCA